MELDRPRGLMDLPAELRIRIYEYYFQDTKINGVTEWPYYAPGLISCNKTIYNEAVKIFYSSATFYIHRKQWMWLLSTIKPYQDLIKCIRVGMIPVASWNEIEWAEDNLKIYRRETDNMGVRLNEGVIQVAACVRTDRSTLIWMNEFGEVEKESVRDAQKRLELFSHDSDDEHEEQDEEEDPTNVE